MDGNRGARALILARQTVVFSAVLCEYYCCFNFLCSCIFTCVTFSLPYNKPFCTWRCRIVVCHSVSHFTLLLLAFDSIFSLSPFLASSHSRFVFTTSKCLASRTRSLCGVLLYFFRSLYALHSLLTKSFSYFYLLIKYNHCRLSLSSVWNENCVGCKLEINGHIPFAISLCICVCLSLFCVL